MKKEAITSFSGSYRFLSNFFPVEVEYRGHCYPTAEHAYQASKAATEQGRQSIAEATSASAARARGRFVTRREGWDDVRLQVMEEVLRAKFSNPRMAVSLIETGDAELVEDNFWNDTFWGVCKGRGENHLGKLLMKIRRELKDFHPQ